MHELQTHLGGKTLPKECKDRHNGLLIQPIGWKVSLTAKTEDLAVCYMLQ